MTVMAAFVGTTGLLALLVWVRRNWLQVTVVGESMSPTFRPGDRILARRVQPERVRAGDVVVIEGTAADAEQFAARIAAAWRAPYEVVDRQIPPTVAEGNGLRMIKRVAATAGERLPFAVPGLPVGAVVPAGRLAVVGDNPDVSIDSRHHGFITLDQVMGRVGHTASTNQA